MSSLRKPFFSPVGRADTRDDKGVQVVAIGEGEQMLRTLLLAERFWPLAGFAMAQARRIPVRWRRKVQKRRVEKCIRRYEQHESFKLT